VVTGRAPLGALPEGVAYDPTSQYVYVGNYLDKTLQVFRIVNGQPEQVGAAIALPGQPASMRGVAR
jgi:DNA-binding beta-propeller fold protein YncE